MSAAAPRRGLPRTVWALGVVSLCMDFSSELVHSLLPVYMTVVLGASVVTVGVIEGIAEATASVLKAYSGALSDRFRRRKPLVVAGYALAALSKPLFPLAGSAATILAARVLDRLGKGIRGAPRDALIADVTPAGLRGAAYGLRQALDSIGAVLGPLAAIALMLLLANDIRGVLWVAALPAFAAVVVLVLAVHEPRSPAPHAIPQPLFAGALRELGARYWTVVALGAVFTLARFSEAFLVLRAADVGLPLAWTPSVMVVMAGVYALISYPAGVLADRGGQRGLLVAGFLALIAADVALAEATSIGALFAGVALWGLHMGFTQGLLSALIADAAPSARVGTAFGVFHLVSGAALLAASALAGWLWSALGAAWTFYAGAMFASVALFGLLAASRRG